MYEIEPVSQPSDLQEISHFKYILENDEEIDIPLPKMVEENDGRIITLWLNNKARKTQIAYAREISRFYSIVKKSIQQVEIDDIYLFMKNKEIKTLKDSSQARALASVKSLFTYASLAVVGALPINVTIAVKLPKVEDTLAERIRTSFSFNIPCRCTA